MKFVNVYEIILIWFIAMNYWVCRGGGCREEERRALLEIRNSIQGLDLSSWDGNDCCEFDGVGCSGYPDQQVSEIRLVRETNSTSTWFPNVTLFTEFGGLENLGLSEMHIGGDLQAFCELKTLKWLNILDLGNNVLEGSIPLCFAAMQNLAQLDLSNNQIRGNIPPSIFSNKSNLGMFDVSGNQLEGMLSLSIFANLSLYYLDLSNNYKLEVETESSSWIPKFSLDVLRLANCNLNKKNNHVVPSFIATQDGLERLDLSHNSLEGSIPCWLLFNSSINALFLRGNKFDAPFLSCQENRTSLLEALDISDNHLKGPLPKSIGNLLTNLNHVNMSSNALEGSIPSSLGLLFLEILDLSNNLFSGEIPRSLTKNRLVYLNLSNNKLQGKMLPRDANMTDLECLQLSGNRFEGVISPAISNSPSLVILDVRNNNLAGNIPKWLYGHPHLVAVLLGGNRLEGHLPRGICQMETLQVLDISKNDLLGGIPSCLDNITFWKKSSPSPGETNYFTQNGRLNYLLNPIGQPTTYFDIGTEFITKHVMYNFEGTPLSLMTGIDMSLNKLTGSIPSKIGELSQLRSLNLSHNLLTGSIPTSFRNLRSVESLDLSHNNLSGKIPYEMVELTSLSTFSVAYNNLSGKIPFEQQFSTFEMNCYDGNPFLCGEPSPRNCSPVNSSEPQLEGEKEGTSVIDSPLFFYAYIAVSYILGFWVFFGILIYNKRWRQNFFSEVDRSIQKCFDMFSKFR